MITYYTEADLVSFGNHLLSKQRTERVLNHPDPGAGEELLSMVHDADLANWRQEQGFPNL